MAILMDGILPKNATPYERVLASNVNRLLDLDTERLRYLWNPWRCHEDDLPYLAWALSVDIWDTDWPTTKKRSVVANAVNHHRMKGTLAGLETYLALVDVGIEEVLTPSTKVFSGPSLTAAEREAWLSSLPQVRVYFSPEEAAFQSSTWSGGLRAKSFMGLDFLVPSTAPVRLSRRAAYVVDGVETHTTVARDADGELELHVRAERPDIIFSGGTLARSYVGLGFFYPSTASQRIVTIAPNSDAPWRTPVGPQLTPVSTKPDLVAQRGEAGCAVYSGDPIGSGFFLPSTAKRRLFERYAIDDGRAVRKRPSISFMGIGRYGMPGHTAEIRVRIRAKQPAVKAGEGTAAPGERFWLPHDSRPLDRTCQAADASRRLSDRILLDTKTAAGFVAGQIFIAGRDVFTV